MTVLSTASCSLTDLMRPAAFATIAFLAGQHGFGIFVPYLGVFLVVACAIRPMQRRAAAAEAPATNSMDVAVA